MADFKMRIQFEPETSYMASSFEKSRCFILPHVSFCPGLPYSRGGGGTLIFSYIRGLGSFFFGGGDFNIFGVFGKINIIWGH